MGKHVTSSHLSLKVFKLGFTMVPRIWVDELMPKHADGIPASFWKFMLILWRDIVDGNSRFVARKTTRQFHMRQGRAQCWVAALSVSGVFKVHYGEQRTADSPGSPTRFRYLDSTLEEWAIFLEALAAQLQEDKHEHFSNTENMNGFRACLAFRVDSGRAAAGLPRTNEPFLDWCERAGVIVKGENDRYSVKRGRTDRVGLDPVERAEIRGRRREESAMYLGMSGKKQDW